MIRKYWHCPNLLGKRGHVFLRKGRRSMAFKKLFGINSLIANFLDTYARVVTRCPAN
jgi:hypothetical protein